MSEKSPLPAVCMPAEDQIHGGRDERIIFRMVRQEQFEARLSGEVHNPVRLWLMSSGAGGTSDAVQILSPWITRFGWLCGAEGSIVCNVAGSETGDDQSVLCHPLIIQHSYAGIIYICLRLDKLITACWAIKQIKGRKWINRLIG